MNRLFLGSALVTTLALGCAHAPVFNYDVSPNWRPAAAASVALDPRELVWNVAGQRMVGAGPFRPAVVQSIKAKGYHFVDAPQADLWVHIVVMSPVGGNTRTIMPSREGRTGDGMRGGAHGMRGGPAGSGGFPSQDRAYVGEEPASGVTLVVELVERANLKTCWYGSVEIPPAKPGSPDDLALEEWVRRLLLPLPGANP